MGIVVNSLFKSFGEPAVEVLKDISLEIKDGEFIALTGRSGSGKSTLLYILGSLDGATQGDVVVDGKNLSRLKAEEIHRFRNQNLGFVFQFHYLLSELTAVENVLMPALKAGTIEQKRDEAGKLLERFGLGDKLHRYPRQLSGGEQQRVAIARALIMRPKYIFADEPTGSLDSVSGEVVLKLFEEINRTQKTTIIMVTHDEGYAARASRQVKLVDGRVVSGEV
jgi:putative ABC transport system ATP-binding protein/lipoprotein-releasing system ATP-binding protein